MGWIDKTKGLFVVLVVAITSYFIFAPDNAKTSVTQSSSKGKQAGAFQLAFFPDAEPSHLRIQTPQTENSKQSEQCNNIMHLDVLTKEWARAKLATLRRSLADENVILPSYDFAFRHLGLSAVKARELVLGSRRLRDKLRYQNETPPEISHKNARLIQNFIRFGEISPIKAAIDAGNFPINSAIRSASGMVTLLENIIIEADHPELLIKQMMQLGILPTYTDLATATMFGVDASVVIDMYYASGLSANKVLRDAGNYQSLLVQAVQAQNPELITFWLEQGSQVNPDVYSPNALDLLQDADAYMSQVQLHDVIISMLNTGASPNTQAGADWLKQQLSEAEAAQFAEQLIPTKLAQLSPEQRASAELLMAKVRQLVLPSVVDFDTNVVPEHACLNFVSHYVMNYIEENTSQTRRYSAVAQKQERKALLAKFDEAESLFIQQKDVEVYLSPDDSIEGKELVEAYRREILARKVKKKRKDAQSQDDDFEELIDDAKSLYKSVLDLVKAQRWQEAIDYVKAEGSSEQLSFVVNLLILYNAPHEFVFRLLDEGVELSSSIMYQLMRHDDVDLAKALIPYGLDVNFKNPLGESGIKLSVSFRAEGMFHFLLSQGVDLDAEPRVFDALDAALQHFDMKHGKDVFVKGLIEAGAPVRLSHKQWVERKKLASQQTYDYLIQHYPQLKM